MNTKIKNIKMYLESNNVNPTYHRIVIFQYMENSTRHPTAEQIYTDIKKEIPTISKTTVYNTLNSFVKNGIAEKLNIADSEVHYDIPDNGHDHFLCINCGKIYDIKPEYSKSNIEIKSIQGHKITQLHCYYKGICKSCRNDKK
ncbi:MAG: transcriptional repressor [Candidatus Marinimicrobia bacterium]|nr:transcriptional repressor [Candidatus Neomarinimicrobiota bacterium]